jgi:hypothetical protein
MIVVIAHVSIITLESQLNHVNKSKTDQVASKKAKRKKTLGNIFPSLFVKTKKPNNNDTIIAGTCE